jgi:hypothetical protein
MPIGELINRKYEVQGKQKGRKFVGDSQVVEQGRLRKELIANKDFGMMSA